MTVDGRSTYPIGIMKLVVKIEGTNIMFPLELLVVPDEDCAKFQCLISEKIIKRFDLLGERPFFRLVLSVISRFRPYTLSE